MCRSHLHCQQWLKVGWTIYKWKLWNIIFLQIFELHYNFFTLVAQVNHVHLIGHLYMARLEFSFYPQIYTRDPRPPVSLRVMVSSAMGLNLKIFVFLLTLHGKTNAIMIFVRHLAFNTCFIFMLSCSICSDICTCQTSLCQRRLTVFFFTNCGHERQRCEIVIASAKRGRILLL